MAKTVEMRLLELVVLKSDIVNVIEYLGKTKCLQFQAANSSPNENGSEKNANEDAEIFTKLQEVRRYLNIADVQDYGGDFSLPNDEEKTYAQKMILWLSDYQQKENLLLQEQKRLQTDYSEALSLVNLQIPSSSLNNLTYLAAKIGRIKDGTFDSVVQKFSEKGVVIPLGRDRTKIIVFCTKKHEKDLIEQFALNNIVNVALPPDFAGIKPEVIVAFENAIEQNRQAQIALLAQKTAFANENACKLLSLLKHFSVGAQINIVKNNIDSTKAFYRISGWFPLEASHKVMQDLDEITKGKIAIKQFCVDEVDGVKQKNETVPVKLKNNKVVGNFERMVFSYASPLYGTIDPTPFIAVFYTLLFGIMFGDAGQGLVFLILGILMATGVIKKFPVIGAGFGYVFICIGSASIVMGILTGEFFGTETVLSPLSKFLKSIFGVTSPGPILHLMPSTDSITKLFIFMGFTLAVGFVINSVGLVINIVNNFTNKKVGKALFGKTGVCGTLFFWYVVIMALRIAFFKHSIQIYDWIIIGFTLFGVFFAEPLERLVDKKTPIFPDGVLGGVILGVVELLEVLSTYISNSVSFLRVGAFAVSHAVLGFITFSLTSLVHANGGFGGTVGGFFVLLFFNVLVIVLEGMIVAIQVVRLQYYEFFSKFFTETGKEFTPFEFKYKDTL